MAIIINGVEFNSNNEYKNHLARRKINPETSQPFKSRSEYERHLAGQRQKRPENVALVNLIKNRLNRLGKDQKWLAEMISVTDEAVSGYIHGDYLPSSDRLTKLFSALEVHYKTLDDLVRNAEAILS